MLTLFLYLTILTKVKDNIINLMKINRMKVAQCCVCLNQDSMNIKIVWLIVINRFNE